KNGVRLVAPWGTPAVVYRPVAPRRGVLYSSMPGPYVWTGGSGLQIRDKLSRERRNPMVDAPEGRGVLYPSRLPSFHREPAPAKLRENIRWFWIPRWRLPPGRASRQKLLAFPASNLVIEPRGVTLSGPTTGASHRDLRGTGW